jgi:Phytanoyl-CoA dioxygenase (PhyH)
MCIETTHEYLPTAADVAFYQEHGWWVSPAIIPDEVLRDAQHGADRHYAGERDAPLLISGGYLDWRPEHGAVVRLNDYVSLQNDDIRRLMELPVIAATAGRLSGAKSLRLFHDQLVCKPPGLAQGGSKVGWHVDAAYWKTCSSRRMLTAWIPFQDCDEEMGALSFIDRSHKLPDTEWMTTFNEQDLEKLESRVATAGRTIERAQLKIKRGQVSFHHCLTIHGSLANRSQRDRLALAIHFQDETNRYVEQWNASGTRVVHMNDLLCRRDQNGGPDYSDPDICPLLWADPNGVPRPE